MKIFFLLFLVFSTTSKADTPDWPTQLFSAERLYQSFLRPFQNYFRDINRAYVVINISPTLRRISSSKYTLYYFKILITRSITEDSITEVINFSVRDQPSGRVIIKRSGKNLVPTENEDLFSFNLPGPTSAEKFQLIFENALGLKMNFSNSENILTGRMLIFNGEVTVLFNEAQRDANFYTRSLWYICGSCDSSALIANAQRIGAEDWQYLYKTSRGGAITSQDFYSMYTNFYSPPIVKYFESLLENFWDHYDWP